MSLFSFVFLLPPPLYHGLTTSHLSAEWKQITDAQVEEDSFSGKAVFFFFFKGISCFINAVYVKHVLILSFSRKCKVKRLLNYFHRKEVNYG